MDLQLCAREPARTDDAFLTKLKLVDWGFTARASASELESIHPYPARFITEIPRTLIQHLPIPAGTGIFDPFCGSGTTLVEAQRAGYTSVGIDLNPIACLISRVKTAELPIGLMKAAALVVSRAKSDTCNAIPAIPNVGHWFKPDIQQAVSALARALAEPRFDPWRDHLRLALSSILVRVSNQESDTRYAAIEKPVTADHVFAAFTAGVAKLERALARRSWPLNPVHVVEANTLEVQPGTIGTRIGLVVTSPPYPNAYEYWLYHKYRMWWLGFDPLAVKEKEIGARAHFFKKNHHTAELFIDQMRQTFGLIDRILVPRGFVCFVVGRSKIHGKIIDNAAIIRTVARDQGLDVITGFERVISPSRKSFNLSHANIKKESVLIFQKA